MEGLYFTTTDSNGQSEILVIGNLKGPEEWTATKDYTVAWTMYNWEK